MNSHCLHHRNKDIAYLLYNTSRLIRRRFSERISDLGLSEAQWRVIGFLCKGEGFTQTELALLLGIQKAPLGEHIDRLETMGWIVRSRDPRDRRVNRISLRDPASDRVSVIEARFYQLAESIHHYMGDQLWQNLQRTLADLVRGFCPQQMQVVLARVSFNSNLHLISSLSRQLRKRYDGALKKIGFTRSQWMVLLTVINEQGISQTELGRLLDIPKAPLGQVLDELECKQWLLRKQDVSDMRIKRLRITDKTQSALDNVITDYRQLHRDIINILGDDDLKSLQAGLHQLQQCLLELSVEQPTVRKLVAP